MKIHEQDAGHISKMAPMPLYGKKHFKNLLLQNPWTDFHETWYVASGTPAHHSLFKWWPWVDLDLFYGKVKFGNLGFFIGKIENSEFSETIEACDLKVGRCRQLIELMKVWKVKVISWPCPQDIYIWKSKLVFLRNYWAIFNQILYVSFQVQGNENPWTWCWSHDQDGHHTLIW